MQELTKDTFLMVARFLSVQDLGRLATAHPSWKELVYNSDTWRHRFFGDLMKSGTAPQAIPKIQIVNARENYRVFCAKRNTIMADTQDRYDLLEILEEPWEMFAVMGDWDKLQIELSKFDTMPSSKYEELTPVSLVILGDHDHLIPKVLNHYSLSLGPNLENIEDITTITCISGRLNTLKRLFEAGVDLNLPEDNAPILTAAQYGHEDLVMQLANWGIDVTVTDEIKSTVLHYLARFGKEKSFWLLANRFNLDTQAVNISEITPAYYAAEGGFIELFKQLRTGAEHHYKVLGAAMSWLHHDFVAWYIKDQELDIHDPKNSLKHLAAEAGDWDSYIKYNENHDLEEQDDLGNTVAHYAAELEDLTFLQNLFELYGPRIFELRCRFGETILQSAENSENDVAINWIKEQLSSKLTSSK